jgi:hypothetical protein
MHPQQLKAELEEEESTAFLDKCFNEEEALRFPDNALWFTFF